MNKVERDKLKQELIAGTKHYIDLRLGEMKRDILNSFIGLRTDLKAKLDEFETKYHNPPGETEFYQIVDEGNTVKESSNG